MKFQIKFQMKFQKKFQMKPLRSKTKMIIKAIKIIDTVTSQHLDDSMNKVTMISMTRMCRRDHNVLVHARCGHVVVYTDTLEHFRHLNLNEINQKSACR